MRIISGKRRGLKLKAPDGMNTRPTESRIKESLFNILGNVSNSNVLDLFSGTGSIGIEFLSRGANICYFVESNNKTLDTLNYNLNKANLDSYKVFPYDYKKSLNDIIINEDISFDYIYIDPPYEEVEKYNKSLEIIYNNTSVFNNGLIIVESNKNYKVNNLNLFNIIDERNYRETLLYFLRRK